MMRHPMTSALLILLWCSLAVAADDQSGSSEGGDEAAVRAAGKAYVEAFNRGDADAMAALWADSGVFIDRGTGEEIDGREAILAALKKMIAVNQGARLSVVTDSIRFLKPTIAVEKGTTTLAKPGEPPSESDYTAIHVKKDGQWRLDSVRELVKHASTSNYERLKPLEWLIGHWVDEVDGAKVDTTCKWTANKNFLTRTFKVTLDGEVAMHGTQVIGWDAAAGRVRSWVFDSDGSFSEGNWKQEGDRWTIRTASVLPDGRRSTAVNVLIKNDDNSFSWQAIGREIDGELLPNIEPVTIVRAAETP